MPCALKPKNLFRISWRLVLFFALGAGCVSNRIERFHFGAYSEGEKLFQEEKYEEAILKYQAYIDENPAGNMAVIARYSIAKSHLALGHVDQAKSYFKKIAAEHKGLIWAELSEKQLEEMISSGQTE